MSFNDYFDALNGYLLITDARAHILYASKGLERKKGFLVKDVAGKNPSNLWGGHMTERFYKNMWGTIADKKMAFVGSVNNRTHAGERDKEVVHIVPVLDDKGNVKYYIEIQPDLVKSNENTFQKEFLSAMQKKNTPSQFVHHMWSWLQENKTRDSEAAEDDLLQIAGGLKDVSGFLETIFISEKNKEQAKEEDLLAGAQINAELYGQLYERYKDKILRYFLHHLGGNMVLAEDLTEDTFSRALERIAYFKITHASYFAYLIAAAHNILVNYYRHSKSISLDALPHLTFEESFSLMQHMEFALLWQRIKMLSPIEQQILIMKYQDDLSVAQIAKALSRSGNAIKLMLSRGRRKLRTMIA